MNNDSGYLFDQTLTVICNSAAIAYDTGHESNVRFVRLKKLVLLCSDPFNKTKHLVTINKISMHQSS